MRDASKKRAHKKLIDSRADYLSCCHRLFNSLLDYMQDVQIITRAIQPKRKSRSRTSSNSSRTSSNPIRADSPVSKNDAGNLEESLTPSINAIAATMLKLATVLPRRASRSRYYTLQINSRTQKGIAQGASSRNFPHTHWCISPG